MKPSGKFICMYFHQHMYDHSVLYWVALQNENTAVKLELSELRGMSVCVRVCYVFVFVCESVFVYVCMRDSVCV